MTAHHATSASSTASNIRRNAPAPAATDLAHDMLANGWTLASAAVRVIHTAHLTDGSGLTIAVSSEAGEVRLDFYSEYRRLAGDLSRQAWYAEATPGLPVEILAAVTSANTVASDDDSITIGEYLTAAGWSRPCLMDRKWVSPHQDREVVFIDEELEGSSLPWEIHRKAGRPITVFASADTPAVVIAALALTDTGPISPQRPGRAIQRRNPASPVL